MENEINKIYHEHLLLYNKRYAQELVEKKLDEERLKDTKDFFDKVYTRIKQFKGEWPKKYDKFNEFLKEYKSSYLNFGYKQKIFARKKFCKKK